MALAIGSIGVGSPGAMPALANGGGGRGGRPQVEGEAVVCIGGSHGDCSLKRQQPGLVESLDPKVWPLCFLLFGTNVQSGPFRATLHALAVPWWGQVVPQGLGGPLQPRHPVILWGPRRGQRDPSTTFHFPHVSTQERGAEGPAGRIPGAPPAGGVGGLLLWSQRPTGLEEGRGS